MTAFASALPRSRTHLVSAAVLTVVMVATVGGALALQHIGGYIPCKLCYEQRIPYYVGAPLMALALVSAGLGWPSSLTRLLLAVGGLLMVYSLYLGVTHAGIEWGWWPGPTDCGMVEAPATGGSGGILDQIDKVMPPSCDKAALRILGLSLAGWNAVVSLVLAVIAFRAAAAKA